MEKSPEGVTEANRWFDRQSPLGPDLIKGTAGGPIPAGGPVVGVPAVSEGDYCHHCADELIRGLAPNQIAEVLPVVYPGDGLEDTEPE